MHGCYEDSTKMDFMLTELSQSASRPSDLGRGVALCVNGIQGDFRGMDAANDTRFPGLLFERIDRPIVVGMGSVAPGQLVQVVERTIFDQLHFPTDFEVAGRILRVHD